MDPVVHFEVPADDTERAKAFYTTCFGWNAVSMPGMGYTLFHTTKTDEQGMVGTPGNINGGMFQRHEKVDRVVFTVAVEDLEASLRKVQDAGGAVVMGKDEVPGVGYVAYVKDTEGNLVGLIQPLR